MTARPLHIVVASDDIFAMPLTVAATSAVITAKTPASVHVTVMDCGISARNRKRIEQSIRAAGGQVRVVPFTHHVPDSALQGGVIPSVATFARLFAADYALDADRAVYLDSDTVALTDLHELVDLLEPGMLLGGVADGQGDGWLRNVERLQPLLPDTDAARQSPYVNGGVLVMDLAAWRSEGITQRLADLVATTPLRFADQDVVNVVCAGRIQSLPVRWNTQTLLVASTDRAALGTGPDGAGIVHYTSRPKPWHLHGDVGLAGPWFDAVDHTAWKGWRPTQRRLLVPKLRRGWRLIRTRPGQLWDKYRPGGRSSAH
jgi:lipopolysaccharide biosynthesis glycosyltransferase